MPNAIRKMVILAFCIMASGCARNSVYKQWGQQIDVMSRNYGKPQDVSMLIGATPHQTVVNLLNQMNQA